MKTHRERARQAVDWLNRTERSKRTEVVAEITRPTELLKCLKRYVTFHQGHVLPPELVSVQGESRAALALYEPEEG